MTAPVTVVPWLALAGAAELHVTTPDHRHPDVTRCRCLARLGVGAASGAMTGFALLSALATVDAPRPAATSATPAPGPCGPPGPCSSCSRWGC